MSFCLRRIISNVKSVLQCPTTPLQLQSWDVTTHPSFWPSSAIWSWFKELNARTYWEAWPQLTFHLPLAFRWAITPEKLREWALEHSAHGGVHFCTGQVGRTSIQLRPGKFDWVFRAESSSHLASRWLANLALQLEDTLSSQKKICRETVPSFPWFVPQPQAPPSHSRTAAHQLVLISRVKWKQRNLHHLTSDIYLQMFIFLQHIINSKKAWTPIHQCVFG